MNDRTKIRIARDVLVEAQLEEERGHGEGDAERDAGDSLAADASRAEPPDPLGGPVAGSRRLAHSSDSGSTSTDHGASGPSPSSATGSVPRRTTFQRQRSARRAMYAGAGPATATSLPAAVARRGGSSARARAVCSALASGPGPRR